MFAIRLLARKCEGGPLDGKALHLIEIVKQYQAQTFAHVSGELVPEFHTYRLNNRGVFIYTGKE